jgi:hypothetical protein
MMVRAKRQMVMMSVVKRLLPIIKGIINGMKDKRWASSRTKAFSL